jgi:putative serine protease PepD
MDFSIPTNKIVVNVPMKSVNNKPGVKTSVSSPLERKNPGLPMLVVPGFNDHNVIMFGRKPAKAEPYKPVNEIEKTGMHIFQNVAPSVVRVNVESTRVVMDPQTGEVEEIPAGGLGSGSILDKEGYIVTNFHVVSGADKISVEVEKGKEIPAKLIGEDPSTDLALIKLDLPKEDLAKLPVMKLGQSESAQGGQDVFAVGNPFGLYRTMTKGLVSALNRSIVSPDGRMTKSVIQTDASINPGNSGGALINARGEQIGINTQIYSPSGASAGLGFAIPIDTAKEVIKDLKTQGRVIRPYIGISGGTPVEVLPPQLKQMLGIKSLKQGVILKDIAPGGPAENAGLKGGEIMLQIGPEQRLVVGGDIITKINGKPVSNMTEMFEQLDKCKIGEALTVEYHTNEVVPDPEKGRIDGKLSQPKTVKLLIDETPDPKKSKTSGPLPLEDFNPDDFGFRS